MNEHPLVTEYRNFSPESAAFSARAAQVFPGGDTRASAQYKPYPLAIERATGSRLYDIDHAMSALRDTLAELKPYIESENPRLLVT